LKARLLVNGAIDEEVSMDRFVSVFYRRAPGALALAAALLLVHPPPARAQSICGNKKCMFTVCFTDNNGNPVCLNLWAGCYSTAPMVGHCLCPMGSNACMPSTEALTGDGGPPTDQQLVDEGFDVCHELVRERRKTDREVVLVDKETAPAVLTGPNSVGVSGFAHPRAAVIAKDPRGLLDLGPARNQEDEPVGRRFDCEVQRNEKGYWTPLAMTLAEDQK
jgi:hypothetical protein